MPALWNWPFEPVVVLGVELAAVLYLIGGAGVRTPRWRSVAYWVALLSILLALQSPIEMIARQLFWVHMVQHLLLMVVAAPLLALASPWTRLWRALPRAWRRAIARPLFRDPRLGPVRRVYRGLSNPLVIWFGAAVNLWLWHLPVLYDVTLRNHLVHHLEHMLFLSLSVAFWACVIDQYPFHSRLTSLQRAVYVFLAMVQSWGLAAILSLAPTALYAYSSLTWRPGGISALTDQQLGGGIMWVPGAITSSLVFIALLFRWLAEEDSRSELLPLPAADARRIVGG